MAARKTKRRKNLGVRHAIARGGKIVHVLVRGSARNPQPIIGSRRKSTLKKLANVLRGHFPGARIRVQKVRV